MHTLKLNINDLVYDKFIGLLNKFQKDEVEIVSDDIDFQSAKKYLQTELDEINSGKAKFLSEDEFDLSLEKILKKYENHI